MVVTELRPSFTLTRELRAIRGNLEEANSGVLLAVHRRPTYNTSLRFSNSIVPSTLRSERALVAAAHRTPRLQ